jgi:hypothetical protein
MTAYSFLDVNATLVGAGAIIDLGAGAGNAGTGISITQTNARNTMTMGLDGEGMHSLSADKSGVVKIQLLQTSPVNAKLMALYDAQTLNSSLWGQNIITITNSASGDAISCRGCAFQKRPDLGYQKDGATVEWAFDALKVDAILGTY